MWVFNIQCRIKPTSNYPPVSVAALMLWQAPWPLQGQIHWFPTFAILSLVSVIQKEVSATYSSHHTPIPSSISIWPSAVASLLLIAFCFKLFHKELMCVLKGWQEGKTYTSWPTWLFSCINADTIIWVLFKVFVLRNMRSVNDWRVWSPLKGEVNSHVNIILPGAIISGAASRLLAVLRIFVWWTVLRWCTSLPQPWNTFIRAKSLLKKVK